MYSPPTNSPPTNSPQASAQAGAQAGQGPISTVLPQAQVDQAAQAIALQQLEQAKQNFSMAAQAVVGLGQEYPMIADQANEIASALLQLMPDVVASIQQSPMSPPAGI